MNFKQWFNESADGQAIAQQAWFEAKKAFGNLASREDGSTKVFVGGVEYRVDFEWWGPGCIFDSMQRGRIKWPNNEEEFEDDFDYMDEQEKEYYYKKELRLRVKAGVFKGWKVVGYGWEHPQNPHPDNDYCSVGYVVLTPATPPKNTQMVP